MAEPDYEYVAATECMRLVDRCIAHSRARNGRTRRAVITDPKLFALVADDLAKRTELFEHSGAAIYAVAEDDSWTLSVSYEPEDIEPAGGTRCPG